MGSLLLFFICSWEEGRLLLCTRQLIPLILCLDIRMTSICILEVRQLSRMITGITSLQGFRLFLCVWQLFLQRWIIRMPIGYGRGTDTSMKVRIQRRQKAPVPELLIYSLRAMHHTLDISSTRTQLEILSAL